MIWWLWIVLGGGLLVIEIATPGGFYFIFFGVSALIVGILAAMEKQMRAEREKRATILTSEGVRDAAINTAEGDKQQVIKASEANRQQQINEAEGQAAGILSVASATAEGIRQLASAIQSPGGQQAVQLRVAEQYIGQFGNLAKEANTLVVPANLTDVAAMIALAMNAIKQGSATAGS